MQKGLNWLEAAMPETVTPCKGVKFPLVMRHETASINLSCSRPGT